MVLVWSKGASTTQSEWEENPAVCSVFSAATTAFIRETSLFGPELRPYKRSCVSVSHTKSSSSPSINSPNSRRPSETGKCIKHEMSHGKQRTFAVILSKTISLFIWSSANHWFFGIYSAWEIVWDVHSTWLSMALDSFQDIGILCRWTSPRFGHTFGYMVWVLPCNPQN